MQWLRRDSFESVALAERLMRRRTRVGQVRCAVRGSCRTIPWRPHPTLSHGERGRGLAPGEEGDLGFGNYTRDSSADLGMTGGDLGMTTADFGMSGEAIR